MKDRTAIIVAVITGASGVASTLLGAITQLIIYFNTPRTQILSTRVVHDSRAILSWVAGVSIFMGMILIGVAVRTVTRQKQKREE